MPKGYEVITENIGDIFKEIQRLRVLLLPFCQSQSALNTNTKLEKQLLKLEVILKIENKDKR